MIGKLQGWLAAAGAAVLAVLGIFLAGKREGRQRAAEKAAEADAKTRERIDEVHVGDDPHAAARWLRERGQR